MYEDKQCKDCFFATYLGQCLYHYKYVLLDMPACKLFVPMFIANNKKNNTDAKNNNRQM